MEIFPIRRAVERLRAGLFDPVAVNCLTVERDRLNQQFAKGLKALEKGNSEHLCICGSYGQGKSHTIAYLNQHALSAGFATSIVQLDLREVPFHQFPIVYRSIMEKLSLPDNKSFKAAWKEQNKLLDFPEKMPHRFQMILKAMLLKNRQLSPKEKSLKKHRNFRPKEFGYWLERALKGHNVPAVNLKRVFKYRMLEGHQNHSLICRGNASYAQMVQSLGRLLKEMGYKGLLLFFDEAESITQGRPRSRAKSYEILDYFFQSHDFVYPIFAFTDDFFEQVNSEIYDDDREIFSKNYAEDWKNLNIFRLQDFSSQEWASLLNRLIQLYRQAYRVELGSKVKESLLALLKQIAAQETRFKLKALVNQLDIETQTS